MNTPKSISALDPPPPGDVLPEEHLDKKKSEWMFSTHYHCKVCQSDVVYLGRISWTVKTGVRAVGCCRRCALFMVEFEDGRAPLWIDIDKP